MPHDPPFHLMFGILSQPPWTLTLSWQLNCCCFFLFVCFHVFIDAGDNAPSRKEISHVLVRPKQQRDAERQFNATFHTHAKNNINTLKRSQPQFLRKDAKSSSCLSNCAHKQGGTKQDEGKPSSQTATMFTLKRK